MSAVDQIIASKLGRLPAPLRVRLPSGKVLGAAQAPAEIEFRETAALGTLARGDLGALAAEIVHGRVEIRGGMRDLMRVVAALVPDDGQAIRPRPWQRLWWSIGSILHHSRSKDAEQIRFHYDISDDFYAIWLDPLRVYSCAYFRDPDMDLAQAQLAKLDHICRKLDLRPGERFVDIGAGWGGLLFHAAEHYGVDAIGITLSRNQFDHVSRMIDRKGLSGRVRIQLCDYRDLRPDQPFDKLASVGMFEHVGRANLPAYFRTLLDLLRPGGLALNHGITLTGLDEAIVGGGLGDFIEKFIFPGGELVHVSHAIRLLSQAGMEMVDTENLRPHYARTLWAWSDGLEAHLAEAEEVLRRGSDRERAARTLRAFRLYLAGCALAFEENWTSLYQILMTRPDAPDAPSGMAGAHADYPFTRDHIYAPRDAGTD
ncbi:class I SAM-dependent methyltransferase [Paracoccus siganidrum]|uniref:Methyltransferase domain-containing protein n=1 Tax=Paracoccus siganidrum TaxID=1276757 RepID=A0A418ZV29_9RHOB|nr:class I SAM-dependent methyltransferase [Paracoccus siganidrum]RJL04075.1 methyltransferase domain-containing protein [Paracoccus siganidrum]RMC35877.1 SAM-dependent methyltransferase [Paracoccus siganidrum]